MARSINISQILCHLEDTNINSVSTRRKAYQDLREVFDDTTSINVEFMDKLMDIIEKDLMKRDVTVVSALSALNYIVEKTKKGECKPVPNLLKSALRILGALSDMLNINNVDSVKHMLFTTLLSYPNSVLQQIFKSHYKMITQIVTSYRFHKPDFECRNKAIELLIKLLKALEPEDKLKYVQENIDLWFLKLIPEAVHGLISSGPKLNDIEAVELVTEILVRIDYSEIKSWKYLFELIIAPSKYPLVLRKALEKVNESWYRLWIVFVKLLKDQITKIVPNAGSPINALLPVVETAFKMDQATRCRAFKCWNDLIDNFANEHKEEANTSLEQKRIKLLLIPLKSNNAKLDATAQSKLETWWHLIKSFETKLDKKTILLPFLQFCFGSQGDKSEVKGISLTRFSIAVKKPCVEMFVEMIGHVNCEGCTSVPQLKNRLVNMEFLAAHWIDCLYFVYSAIKMAAEVNDQLMKQRVSCIWKSLFLLICDLAPNIVKAEMSTESLKIIERLLKDVSENEKLADIIVEVLIGSLFDTEDQIYQVMKNKDLSMDLLSIIINVLLDQSLSNFYRSKEPNALLNLFKPLTNFLVTEVMCPCPSNILTWSAEDIVPNDDSLILWTALVNSVCDKNLDASIRRFNFSNLLLWPMRNMTAFSNARAELAWYKWHTLYNLLHLKHLKDSSVDGELQNICTAQYENADNPVYFLLAGAFALLKQKCVSGTGIECEKLANAVTKIVSTENNLQYVDKLLPVIIDCLRVILSTVTEMEIVMLAKLALTLVKVTLNSQIRLSKLEEKDINYIIFIQNLLKQVDELFGVKAYLPFKDIIVEELVQCFKLTENMPYFNKTVHSVLKTLLSKCETNDTLIYIKIKAAIDPKAYARSDVLTNESKETRKADFVAPEVKSSKSKKKNPNIINTVMDNGEEYVVVKSNWKFNPRKLTENQKEKLTKKREDIPALYQDLSQSQDEFKLATWRADSQDTSSSTSKSASKTTDGDACTILKNIPSSEVVPKIMESILSDSNKDVEKINETVSPVPKKSVSDKEPRTPRLALKDRVFRNVRNLMEKSGTRKDNETISAEHNKTFVPVTPDSKSKIGSNAIYSAPPKISSERPSRVIKKPRKFDDSEIFALKRRRRSQNEHISNSEETVESLNDLDVNTERETAKDSEKPPDPPSTLEKKVSNDLKNQLTTDTAPVVVIEPVSQHIMEGNKLLESSETAHSADKNQPCTDNLQGSTQRKDNESDKIAHSLPEKETTEVEKGKEQSSEADAKGSQEVTSAKKTGDLSSVKKKKSRIEKQLMIDMVEGHPLLQPRTEERFTRKKLCSPLKLKRKSLADKMIRVKSDSKNTKSDKKIKDKDSPVSCKKLTDTSVTVMDSEDGINLSSDDFPASEDVIESSQDSSITTISVKSAKNNSKKLQSNVNQQKTIHVDTDTDISGSEKERTILENKRMPTVLLSKCKEISPNVKKYRCNTQDILDEFDYDILPLNDSPPDKYDSRDDISLCKNKTALENSDLESTENMDTQSFKEASGTSELYIINDFEPPIEINTEESVSFGKETQEIAEADTEPMDITQAFVGEETQEIAEADTEPLENSHITENLKQKNKNDSKIEGTALILNKNPTEAIEVDENLTSTLSETIENSSKDVEQTNACSPLKNVSQKNKEFLNDTIEISPIKTLSPVRPNKSSPPETNDDYVVIKLTSPVQSNGEPYKCDSPEIFTEDKTSPDKRDQSPPRNEIPVVSSSPSSLSLKKNRPQIRPIGRAAQMLGLCAPDKLEALMNSDRSVEPEEPKKSSPITTPARRNLRILYNSVGTENVVNEPDNEERENFLKFQRSLPSADSSPAGPILKRKLNDITDDTTVSPASKRKRVSFHDPPVSTLVSVQKYIEPGSLRSPQSSGKRTLPTRPLISKSQKRLENVFKLDTVLTKAVESFGEDTVTVTDDTEMSSMDETPALEIIKTSELNDVDPICPHLLDCEDPIVEIAGELSSPAMKDLLIKELTGKVETIGDLAKMTELEINRLCIKAPKVKVAQKVLSNYAEKLVEKALSKQSLAEAEKLSDATSDAMSETIPPNQFQSRMDIEVQTVRVDTTELAIQTDVISPPIVYSKHTQSEPPTVSNSTVQTIESGCKSTKDIVASCLSEKPDFLEKVAKQLDDTQVRQIADKLSIDSITNLLIKKVTESNIPVLTFLGDQLCERFDSKDLILFCSRLLQSVHDKNT